MFSGVFWSHHFPVATSPPTGRTGAFRPRGGGGAGAAAPRGGAGGAERAQGPGLRPRPLGPERPRHAARG